IPQGDLISFAALTLAALQAQSLPGTVWLILAAALCCAVIDAIAAIRGRKVNRFGWDGALHIGWPLAAALLTWLYVTSGWSSVVAEIGLTLLLIIPFGFLSYRLVFE